jgi:serine phosphatase RsbU (regulator of sigma subunit)
LVVFFFNPLNRWVQDGIDRLFFRKQADYKQTILSVTNTLTSVLDLDAIVQQIMQTVKHEMFIDLVGIGVLDPRSRESYQFVMSDESAAVKNRQSDLRISREDPLLTLLAAEKHMITRYDIEEDARYAQVRAHCEPRFSALSANMVMPLIYQGEMTGVLVLGRKKSGHFYTRDDIDLLTTLANQGAVAIENAKLFTEHLEKGRLEEEMRIARNIQSGMLPDEAPRIEGVQIAATSIPAREVGGDFYDFINLQKNGLGPRVGIAVGDVAGKGISGALVMAASRSILRVLAEAHPAIEDVMHIGNLRLKNDIKKGMFVALLYAIVEPQKNTLTFANAGQTEPIFCPGDAASPPYLVATDGDRFPLGIVEKSRYQEKRVLLDKGDLVVFYTDGIVEAMNERKELYGFDRLLVSVSEGRGLAADALLKKLVTDVALHAAGGEQNDDLTLVVVKIV